MFAAHAFPDVLRALRPLREQLREDIDVDALWTPDGPVRTTLQLTSPPRALLHHRAAFCDDLRHIDPRLLQLHFPRLPSGALWPRPMVLARYPLRADLALHLVVQPDGETLQVLLVEDVEPLTSFSAGGHRWMWHHAHRDASDHEKYGGLFCERSAALSLGDLQSAVRADGDDDGAWIMALCALLDDERALEACNLAGLHLDDSVVHVLGGDPLAFYADIVGSEHPELPPKARRAAAMSLHDAHPVDLHTVMQGLAPWRLHEALLEYGTLPDDDAMSPTERHGWVAVGPMHGRRRWVLQATMNGAQVTLQLRLWRDHESALPLLPRASTLRGVEFELRRVQARHNAGVLI